MLRQTYVDRDMKSEGIKDPLYITLDDGNADKHTIWLGHKDTPNGTTLIRLSSYLEPTPANDAKILKAYNDIVAILRSIN